MRRASNKTVQWFHGTRFVSMHVSSESSGGSFYLQMLQLPNQSIGTLPLNTDSFLGAKADVISGKCLSVWLLSFSSSDGFLIYRKCNRAIAVVFGYKHWTFFLTSAVTDYLIQGLRAVMLKPLGCLIRLANSLKLSKILSFSGLCTEVCCEELLLLLLIQVFSCFGWRDLLYHFPPVYLLEHRSLCVQKDDNHLVCKYFWSLIYAHTS